MQVRFVYGRRNQLVMVKIILKRQIMVLVAYIRMKGRKKSRKHQKLAMSSSCSGSDVSVDQYQPGFAAT